MMVGENDAWRVAFEVLHSTVSNDVLLPLAELSISDALPGEPGNIVYAPFGQTATPDASPTTCQAINEIRASRGIELDPRAYIAHQITLQERPSGFAS
jgi:hypothetical protein